MVNLLAELVAYTYEISAPKTLLLLSHSIKLSLNEFYIYQLQENVTEPTDGKMRGIGDWGHFDKLSASLGTGGTSETQKRTLDFCLLTPEN